MNALRAPPEVSRTFETWTFGAIDVDGIYVVVEKTLSGRQMGNRVTYLGHGFRITLRYRATETMRASNSQIQD